MAFDAGSEVGSARYLLGDAIMQFTRVVMATGEDAGNVSESVLYFMELASPFTRDDQSFATEEREARGAEWKPGMNPVRDVEVRLKQFGATVRSLCRCGVLSKVAQEAKPYVPRTMVKPVAVQ